MFSGNGMIIVSAATGVIFGTSFDNDIIVTWLFLRLLDFEFLIVSICFIYDYSSMAFV